MNVERTLVKYGFSDHEAAVYLGLLKHVETTAFVLAKETRIPRATVYRVLDSLKAMNVVTSWKKNNIAYFTAENPKRLIKILEEKREMIDSILPEMLKARGVDRFIPAAKIYEGKEGLKIVWDDILDTAEAQGLKEIHAISHLGILEYLPKYFPEWLKRREKLGVFSYLITTHSNELVNPTLQTNRYRETRVLPSDSPVKGTIDIYGDKIAFFSLKDGQIYSIIVESATLAEVLRQFFISTWQLLGR